MDNESSRNAVSHSAAIVKERERERERERKERRDHGQIRSNDTNVQCERLYD